MSKGEEKLVRLRNVDKILVCFICSFVLFSVIVSIWPESFGESDNKYLKKYIYDESGRVEKELYYDENNQPVMWNGKARGVVRAYDRNGRNYRVTYIDECGNPVNNKVGYVTVQREYDSMGHIVLESYLDDKDNLIAISTGQYMTRYDYDSEDRKIATYYLNAKGQLMLNNSGYAFVKRCFTNNGSIVSEYYYDLNGKPIALEKGQYGVKYIGNKRKYLDINGKELFQLDNFMDNNPWIVVAFGLAFCYLVSLLSKRFQVIAILLNIVIVLYKTMAFRDFSGINVIPFWSYTQFFKNYRLRLEILNNIWLFIPLGSALVCVVKQKWTLLFPCAFSILIEVCQLLFGIGFCEFDDVISNSLGTIIGAILANIFIKVKNGKRYICKS